MRRILVLLLVLSLTGCSSAPSTMKVDLTTSDAVHLKATYYSPKNSTVRADALLLLHEAYDDSRSWDSFGKAAQERGYAVLAVDLRGHGQSGGEKTFDSTMDNDVDAALAWLKASPAVNTDRIGIVGASLGANLALRGGARYPEIKSVILLSPGMLLWQIDISKAIVDYGPRPLLLVASKEDAYPAGTVQSLNEQALGYLQLQIYPGTEHGTKMMMPHSDLIPLMLDWLQKTIQ
jgi:pimeloyl-ACP methyl ester carboxylesterase